MLVAHQKKGRFFTVRPVFGNTAACFVTMMGFAKLLSMVQWKTGSRFRMLRLEGVGAV